MQTRPLDNLASLAHFSPELVLIGAVLLLIVWDLLVKGEAKITGLVTISLAGLAYSASTSVWFLLREQPEQSLFYGLLACDRFSNVFRILFALVTAIVVVLSIPPLPEGTHVQGRSMGRHDQGEFFTLLMVITLGMNLMAESRNLLMIYLSLEMVSVISFVMAGFKLNDRKSSEAAFKYVVYGGVASGIMVYGMSWIFGLTQSLYLSEIATKVASLTAETGKVPEVVVVGALLILAGFGYKISAAPFHMWTPDVYEGAPTPVAAFLSVGPKAAGFAILVRFFAEALGANPHGSSAGSATEFAPWPVLAGCLAMATMTVGNLSALGQKNVKRMLAYSSIAHAGYMLLGFSVFSETGIASILFYLVVYCFMNLGAFLLVMAVSEQRGGDESLEAFRGLGYRAPMVAAMMALFLFSLTGLPPFAGFIGKFYIFAALIKGGGSWNWTLAVVGVLNSVVSLFYYANVVRVMFLEKSDGAEATTVRPLFGATSVVLAVPTLVLGIYWAPVYDFVAHSLTMVR